MVDVLPRVLARRSVACLIALGVLLAAGAAGADEARSDADVARRLAFIEDRLARATPAAVAWWSAWFYGYMTVSVGQAGFAIVIKDRGLRTDTAVGAAFSSVGVVGLGAFDFPARHAAGTLARLPGETPAQRRRKLAKAEALLAASARTEIVGRGWIPQVAGGALTATSALVLGLAYKRVVSSIVTLISGIGITEAQIFTRPTAAIDDWRAYQRGDLGAATPLGRSAPPTFGVVAHPGGAGISIAF